MSRSYTYAFGIPPKYAVFDGLENFEKENTQSIQYVHNFLKLYLKDIM